MRQRRKCIHTLTIQQNVQLHQLRRTETRRMVVERRITATDTLQLVVEVDDDFTKRHQELDFHTVARNEILSHQLATLAQAKRHDRSDIAGSRDNRSVDIRFLHVLNQRWVRHTRRIVYLHALTMLVIHHVRHVWHRRNHIHVELTVQSLLHNLHVEQTQETTAETKTEGSRTLVLEGERSIVQPQLFQRCTQVLIVLWLYRIHSGKHHWLHLLETSNRLLCRVGTSGNRIAHFHLHSILDTRHDVAHIARAQFLPRNHVHLQHTDFLRLVFFLRVDETHLLALAHHSIHNLEISDDATETVEHRVENQRLQRSRLVTLRMRNALHHSLQDFIHTLPRFSRSQDDFLRLATDEVNDFVRHLLRHGIRHVALVHHGNDFQVVVNRHI